ncbi:Rossmann fold domain-containing protein [Novosphingobium album (ex Liu et al. 2023)]|uniref:Short chain dehydrogenase-like proteobacteria domain-containing protein n=1 Tax=Novosphingobium album (ex Liu et al. 2023) TaxID=3031130 RepID=A0ABT5WSD2_9SPHN|nr:hypothetical protein [Novosphingobium album (ex Liu et al. 2023)]MDE8652937.1 hypothetical protein [Novosphingobium album (ex Liu et al. 2023)]
MPMLRVESLPEGPLDAAAAFHASLLPQALAALGRGEDLTLVFPPAGHAHRAWRLAAVQALAREHAPLRVNALESDDATAIRAADAWLAGAPGMTGQLLPLDGNGAGPVLYQSP